MSRSWLIAITTALVLAAVAFHAMGPDRVTHWARCQLWHATQEPDLVVEGVRFSVPASWCPVGQTQGVSLVRVPSGPDDPLLVVLIDRVPTDPRGKGAGPNIDGILGKSARPSEPVAQHMIGGMLALRTEHERVDESGQRVVSWFFPEKDVMAYSVRVSGSGGEQIDELVSSFRSVD